MNTELPTQKNNNIILILLSPFLILRYAFVGLKAITFDLILNLFNGASYGLDSAYRGAKANMGMNSEIDIEYERIKGKGKKKEKRYNYSNSVLKKLEQEKLKLEKDLKEGGATRNSSPVLYRFKVREKNGKITVGTMNGLSKLDINAFLLNEGYDVYAIETSAWINFAYKETSLTGGAKINTKELIFFLTQLSTYIKAGITLSNAVKILSKQIGKKNKNKSRVYQAISYELALGENFSDALAKQGSMFPPLLINMIKAAEASGTLVETLEDLAKYYTDLNSTKKQMISAVTYPLTILIFSVIVIIFILIFVVPQFTQIYADSGSEIAGITLFVINFSTFVRENILTMILLFFLGIFMLVVAYKNVKAFRTMIQVFLMHIPIVKDIIMYNELTIFSKTFASLLRNNVFITESIDILSKITDNEVYKGILFKAINNIVKGDNISGAFEGHWAVPDVAYFMIVTGEETGDLANMMQKVSEYYQESHKNVINNLKSLVEPLLTSLLAIVVGLIIIAVIVPMYDVYNNISS